MPRAGDRLGEFDLVQEVGRGAMGVVYEARQASLGRRVAVKVLSSAAAGDPVWVERFRAEATAAARLSHASILPVFAVGDTSREEGGVPWFAMEFVEGHDLSEIVREKGPLPPKEAARILRDAALALDHAHGQGVIHRDVKPSNLMLRSDGRVAVTDFGLAKHVGSGSLTTSGSLLGTPFYMSPEQTLGARDAVGPPSDIYGLGATLYETLTGHPPFTGDNPIALLRQIAEKDPVPPSKVRPDVPHDLETITLRCLEKKPENRYPSCLELAADLDRYLRDEPIGSRRPGLWSRVRRLVARNRVASAAVGGALVLLAVGALVFSSSVERREDDFRREIDQKIALARAAFERGDPEGAEEILGGLATDARASEAQQKKIEEGLSDNLKKQVERASESDDPMALQEVMRKYAKGRLGNRAIQSSGTARVTLLSDPPGATLLAEGLLGIVEPLQLKSPVTDRKVPIGLYRVTASAPGRVPLTTTLFLKDPNSQVTVEMRLPLPEEVPTDMVAIGGQVARALARPGGATRVYDLPTFLLDRTEVTVGEYQRFLASLPSDEERAVAIPSAWLGGQPPAGSPKLPVTGVTWAQADAFASWAGKRLPTAEEVELATFGYSGAGSSSALTKPLAQAGAQREAAGRPNTQEQAARAALPVDRPDAFVSASGAVDLLGNAAEWTALTPPGDPWRSQVVGGSYEDAVYAQVTARFSNAPSPAVGFRCAKSLPLPRPLPPLPPLAPGETIGQHLRVETDASVIESFVVRVENKDALPAVERDVLACEGPSSIGFAILSASAPGHSVHVEKVETVGPAGRCQRKARLRFAPPIEPGAGLDVTLEERRIPLPEGALFVRLGTRFDLMLDASEGVEVRLPEHAQLLRTGLPTAVIGMVGGRVTVRAPATPGGASLRLQLLVPDAPRTDASARAALAATGAAWEDLRRLDATRLVDLLAPEYHSDHFLDRVRAEGVFAVWKSRFARADIEWKDWNADTEGDRLVIRRAFERLSLVRRDGKVADNPLSLPRMLVSYLRPAGEGAATRWLIADEEVLAFSSGLGRKLPEGGWIHDAFGLRVDRPFGARLHPAPLGIADLSEGLDLAGHEVTGHLFAFSRVNEATGVPAITRASLERYGYTVLYAKPGAGGPASGELLVTIKRGDLFEAMRIRVLRRGEGAVVAQARCSSPRSAEEAVTVLASHDSEIDRFFAAVHAAPMK